MTKNQFPLFFEALKDAKNPIFADFSEILLRAGLRRNEAASLLFTDIDFGSETFTIRAELSKNGKALTLPAARQVLALLHRRREAESDGIRVFGDSKRFDPRKSLAKLRKAVGSGQ